MNMANLIDLGLLVIVQGFLRVSHKDKVHGTDHHIRTNTRRDIIYGSLLQSILQQRASEWRSGVEYRRHGRAESEKRTVPDKPRIFISTMPISSPNSMFDHLLESSRRDDSNKWSNIGLG